MTSDVVLTAALRQNLLTLQKTQSNIDVTQFRLATGKKVNSALDSPQNFFASRSLNNKASDLARLLDGIGQSISSIESADNAVTAITTLVEQADSIAAQARDALSSGSQEAKAVGTTDLSGVDDLTSLAGIENNDTLTITAVDSDGTITVNAEVVTITTGMSSEELVTAINDLDSGDTDNVIEAKLNADGQLEIRNPDGGSVRLVFDDNDGGETDKAVATSLGFDGISFTEFDGTAAGGTREAVSILSTPTLTSGIFADAGGDALDASTLLTDVFDDAGVNRFTDADDDSTINISVNGETTQTFAINGETIQSLVDTINNNASLNTTIEASYDSDTGTLSIKALGTDLTNIQIGIGGGDIAGTDDANFDFAEFGAAIGTAVAGEAITENYVLSAAAGVLAELEGEYNNVRTQIDQLVSDAGFRGVNLLNGDDLTTYFNSDQTSSLTSEGVVFTSAGLGISAANFANGSSVGNAVTEVRDALDSVRSFGSTLANDLSIIQTRQEFTKSTINNLTAASDKLTLADANEEGTKLLALQTRQQLGITSLSLAAQAQQSVLRLF